MTPKALSEKKMWQKCQPEKRFNSAWHEFDGKPYPEGFYLLYQIMDIELPTLVETSTYKYDYYLLPLSPRRPKWDTKKQSRLIESFLIKIPVPYIMLYEWRNNSYQVIDGQQRITAIREFYQNKLVLTGLELLPELNGMRYNDLPPDIKFWLNGSSFKARAILKAPQLSQDKALELQEVLFELLSTVAVQPETQES